MTKFIFIITLSLFCISCNSTTKPDIKKPESLVKLLQTVNQKPSTLHIAQPWMLGRLLFRLLEYKLNPNLNDVSIHNDIESAALIILEKGVKKTEDYYLIVSDMLQIENGSVCCELYKNELTGAYETRHIKKNPNYILDNEMKLRKWLISNKENQIRLTEILTSKGINDQNDWYQSKK